MGDDIGFIITRHVRDDKTNIYWQLSYACIRKFYPHNKIVIIDDGSDYNFVSDKELYNVTIIQSEFQGRAELLPYVYYVENKFFDTAVILHDSVFIQQYIDFKCDEYKILWSFQHIWDDKERELKLLAIYNDPELLDFYNDPSKWDGCFGGMSVVKHDFLKKVDEKYPFKNLIPYIKARPERCCFERILSCFYQKEANNKKNIAYGHILDYSLGISFEVYINNKERLRHKPLIKVWTGR